MEQGKEEGKEELLRRMIRRLEEKHGKGPGIMGGTAFVVVGTKRE